MARLHQVFVPVLGIALVACGGKQVEETPEPVAATPAPAPVSTPAPAPAPVAVDRPAPDTRRMTLEERIHFDLDRADLSPEARTALAAKAEILRTASGVSLRIDGHADERGSDEYNLVLGNKRAVAAKQYLVSKGIDASRIDVTSLGEERPVDPASNESAWAQNRRDEFEIISGGDRLVAPR